MPNVQFEERIQDSVPKIDDTVAVGEDLDFQRRWWTFERFTWSFFLLILLADVLGVFGRGYFSKAERTAPDGTLHVKYERTERASTPSIMTVEVGPTAIRNGQLRLYVSESLIKELGNQRISPQPALSTLTKGGIIYTFPVNEAPALIEFAMQPSFPGIHQFSLQVPDFAEIHARVLVFP